MAGVKSVLRCIGVDTSGEVSILRDGFGFVRGRVPIDPDPALRAEVSLLQKVRGAKGKHVHLNVIRVGFDSLPQAEWDTAFNKLDYAVLRIADIYDQADIGIGRVEHYRITAAQSDGFDDLGSQDEAEELWEGWGVDNDGLDVFMVRTISASDFIGLSPVGGDCDNGSKDDGLVGGFITRSDVEGIARTFAHECGHFLGLPHNHDSDSCPSTTAGNSNLMAQTKCPSGAGISLKDAVKLTSSQRSDMRDHCAIRKGC